MWNLRNMTLAAWGMVFLTLGVHALLIPPPAVPPPALPQHLSEETARGVYREIRQIERDCGYRLGDRNPWDDPEWHRLHHRLGLLPAYHEPEHLTLGDLEAVERVGCYRDWPEE